MTDPTNDGFKPEFDHLVLPTTDHQYAKVGGASRTFTLLPGTPVKLVETFIDGGSASWKPVEPQPDDVDAYVAANGAWQE